MTYVEIICKTFIRTYNALTKKALRHGPLAQSFFFLYPHFGIASSYALLRQHQPLAGEDPVGVGNAIELTEPLHGLQRAVKPPADLA